VSGGRSPPRHRLRRLAISSAVTAIDRLNEWAGRIFAWLILPTTVIIVYDVTARKWFDSPTQWGYDMGYYLGSCFFMMGMGYTLKYRGHVSIDILYSRLPDRMKDILNVFFYFFLIIPILAVLFKWGVDYAHSSWLINEHVTETVWRPPLYPLKTVIPISYCLLLLQSMSEGIKAVMRLRTGDRR
jgi:TRAP-type mannitol/chloroaromatic compound transport system permease small subunit